MQSWALLAGLAAILAALVLAGGQARVADRIMRANAALARSEAVLLHRGTMPATGFFAGAGLTSPL